MMLVETDGIIPAPTTRSALPSRLAPAARSAYASTPSMLFAGASVTAGEGGEPLLQKGRDELRTRLLCGAFKIMPWNHSQLCCIRGERAAGSLKRNVWT